MVTRESQQFRGVGFDLCGFALQPEALDRALLFSRSRVMTTGYGTGAQQATPRGGRGGFPSSRPWPLPMGHAKVSAVPFRRWPVGCKCLPPVGGKVHFHPAGHRFRFPPSARSTSVAAVVRTFSRTAGHAAVGLSGAYQRPAE